MDYHIFLAGLGFTLGGAVAVALADLWLSRLLLVYIDAVESNVEKLARAVRSGSTDVVVTDIDLKRDSRQNLARTLKSLGWLAVVLASISTALPWANISRRLCGEIAEEIE